MRFYYTDHLNNYSLGGMLKDLSLQLFEFAIQFDESYAK